MEQARSHPFRCISQSVRLAGRANGEQSFIRVKTLLRFVIKSVTVNSSGRPHDEKATNSARLSKPWPQRLFPVPAYLGVDKILQNYQVHFAEKSTDLPVLQSEYITLQGTMVSLIPQSTKNHCEKSLLFSLF